LKSDAKILLRAARNHSIDAVARFARHGYRRSEELILDTCLQVVAKEYGRTFKTAMLEEKLISRHVQYAQTNGYWRETYDYSFRRARFLRQFDALVECFRDKIPLALAAEKRNVDFAGFHFSALPIGRLDQVVERYPVPDFSHLQAPGSLVHWLWTMDVIKFNHANFSNAKFYSVTVDPLARPGGHFWIADFSHANLSGADLRDSYMRGAKFIGANLEGADFRNANTYDADFTGARGAYLKGDVSDDDWVVQPTSFGVGKARRRTLPVDA
jgi:hypothetical protein